MELVYLWVEDYKNIQKQGFNFSLRFDCEFKDEYDENEKLKDNCELVIKPKEHLENFFGENINVTAIVGENGSGKSNLIEIISLLRFEKRISKVLMIYKYQNDLFIFSKSDRMLHNFLSFPIDIQNKTEFNIKNKDINADSLFNLILFNNSLSDFTIQKSSYSLLKTSHYEGFYNGLNILYSGDIASHKEYLEFNSKFYNILSIDNNFFNFLDNKFFFNEYRYELDFHDNFSYSIDEKYKKKLQAINLNYFHQSGVSYNMGQHDEIYDKSHNVKQEYLDARKENLIYAYMTFYFTNLIISMVEHYKSEFKKDFINEILEKELINDLEEKYKIWNDAKKDLNLAKSLYYEIFYYSIVLTTLKLFIKKFKKYVTKLQNVIRKEENNQEINYLEDDYLHYYIEIKYINHFGLLAKTISKNFYYPNFNDNTLLLGGKILSIKEAMPVENKKYMSILFRKGVLNQNFLNSHKRYNYNLLSGGEKQFIKFFINFSYTLYSQSKYEEKQIIFLDEVDLSFHPNWQKKLLKNIIDCILKINLLHANNIKYHLVYITHSPFILSDLPKENVIFLENGKQVDVNINPFGANIHTLLSHGFFMKDGLMGEFAKSKIDEVIKFLNGDTQSKIKDNDEAQKLLNIIGEPIIKNQLQRMLDSKRLSKIDEIDELKKRIAILESQQ